MFLKKWRTSKDVTDEKDEEKSKPSKKIKKHEAASSSNGAPPKPPTPPPQPPPPTLLRKNITAQLESQRPNLPPPLPKKNVIESPPLPRKNPMLPLLRKSPRSPPPLPPKVEITGVKEPNPFSLQSETHSSNIVKQSKSNLWTTELKKSKSKDEQSKSDLKMKGKKSNVSMRFGKAKSNETVSDCGDKSFDACDTENLPRPPSSLLGDILPAYYDLGTMPSPPPNSVCGDSIVCK